MKKLIAIIGVLVLTLDVRRQVQKRHMMRTNMSWLPAISYYM